MAIVMKKTKASKTTPAQRPSAPARAELPNGLWDRIAQKAYELWDTRGRRDGYALQDWLDAEQIVMDETHEARE